MELRKHRHRPQRFLDEQEEIYESHRARIPRVARPTITPPPHANFNPNHPPAAFPTLQGLELSSNNDIEAGRINRVSYEGLGVPVAESEPVIRDRPISPRVVRPFDMSMTEWLASSGRQNPVWRTNMATLAGQDLTNDTELRSSPLPASEELEGDEHDESPEDKAIRSLVEWLDIVPSIQAEILGNLLEMKCSVPNICTKLGLTDVQYFEARAHYDHRNMQIRLENETQAKMTSELLRRPVNDRELGTRIINKYLDIDVERLRGHNLWLCTKADLISARAYLMQCGLNPELAGNFGNGTHGVRASELLHSNVPGRTYQCANEDTQHIKRIEHSSVRSNQSDAHDHVCDPCEFGPWLQDTTDSHAGARPQYSQQRLSAVSTPQDLAKNSNSIALTQRQFGRHPSKTLSLSPHVRGRSPPVQGDSGSTATSESSWRLRQGASTGVASRKGTETPPSANDESLLGRRNSGTGNTNRLATTIRLLATEKDGEPQGQDQHSIVRLKLTSNGRAYLRKPRSDSRVGNDLHKEAGAACTPPAFLPPVRPTEVMGNLPESPTLGAVRRTLFTSGPEFESRTAPSARRDLTETFRQIQRKRAEQPTYSGEAPPATVVGPQCPGGDSRSSLADDYITQSIPVTVITATDVLARNSVIHKSVPSVLIPSPEQATRRGRGRPRKDHVPPPKPIPATLTHTSLDNSTKAPGQLPPCPANKATASSLEEGVSQPTEQTPQVSTKAQPVGDMVSRKVSVATAESGTLPRISGGGRSEAAQAQIRVPQLAALNTTAPPSAVKKRGGPGSRGPRGPYKKKLKLDGSSKVGKPEQKPS